MFKMKEARKAFKEAEEAVADSRCGTFRFRTRATFTYFFFRLNGDQKKTVIKELRKAVDEIKGKDGLEKALNQFMKNPNEIVPQELRLDYLFYKRIQYAAIIIWHFCVGKKNPSFRVTRDIPA